jgi:glycosyltransferase involved in cell wall biosynthesis
MQAKLSIIIPCRNEERFIAECLESLRLDANTSWEAIIIDDCSTDNSRKVIEVFSKRLPNVSYYHLDVNVGQGAARNFGLLLAKGRNIVFLDGDDHVFPQGIQSAMERMEDSGADIVVSPMVRLFKDGALIDNARQGVFAGPDAFACYLAREFASWGSCMSVYRRDFLLREACVFQTRFYYEDVIFCMRAFYHAGKVITTPEPFYAYRCSHDSTTRGGRETTLHLLSSARVYFDIVQFLSSIVPLPVHGHIFSKICDILTRDHLPRMMPVIKACFHSERPDYKREFMHYITAKESRFSQAVLREISENGTESAQRR